MVRMNRLFHRCTQLNVMKVDCEPLLLNFKWKVKQAREGKGKVFHMIYCVLLINTSCMLSLELQSGEELGSKYQTGLKSSRIKCTKGHNKQIVEVIFLFILSYEMILESVGGVFKKKLCFGSGRSIL